MAQNVERAIETGTLSVPDAEHAIDLRAWKQANLLAAPHGGRREILVQPRLEANVMVGEQLLCLPKRVVRTPKGGTGIAGNEAGGVQPSRAVAFTLHHWQTHQRLDAREV